MLSTVMEGPAQAQTMNAGDDGTTLKQIIIFGGHSIRSATKELDYMNRLSADPYPDFLGVPVGYLTPNGRRASGLMGAYFRDYLLHEGVLTGDTNDLSRSYFRANSIERSYTTALKFGEELIPGVSIPVHTFPSGDPNVVFDPFSKGVATVDPARALAEIQGFFGSGIDLAATYSGELSLLSNVLYPPGTQPTPGASQGAVDPTTLPIMLSTNGPAYFTGSVIGTGGLQAMALASDPFVMQYADGFPTDDVAWGRLTEDTLSQQTRIVNLFMELVMRQPYLARVQSSSAASHILRSMLQVTGGVPLDGALGIPESQVLVIISSDTYLTGLAGLLDLHWVLPGYQRDFCAPGGALVFELRQVDATDQYIVRAFYTAQIFDQLRNLTPLTLNAPPATMQLLIPDGTHSATNLDINFSAFSNLMNEAIGLEYVQPFEEEIDPDVLNPYTTDTPTNITATVSDNTLTIEWPPNHMGWILQSLTNDLISGDWVDLPDTDAVNAVAIPMNLTNTAAFYRLCKE